VTFSTFIPPQANQGVGVAFTDRWGGVSSPPLDSFNLDHRGGEDPRSLARNFQILSHETACERIAICAQVHEDHVELVDESFPCFPAKGAPQADGLVTCLAGVALAIRVADCVPVLLADPETHVVGAAHAGRVGLLAGILEETVRAMRKLGAHQIQAWMGPHICASCYEVPDDMAAQAWEQIPATRARSRQATSAIDLGAGAEAVLVGESVTVTRCDPCTFCDSRFFSHRRDHGRTGRQAGLIWMSSSRNSIHQCFLHENE